MAAVSTWEDEIGLNRSIYRRLKKTKESSVCYQCSSEAWAFRLPLLASVCIWHSVIRWLKQDRLFCLSVESPKLVWQLGCTPRDPDSCCSTVQGVALVLMAQDGSPESAPQSQWAEGQAQPTEWSVATPGFKGSWEFWAANYPIKNIEGFAVEGGGNRLKDDVQFPSHSHILNFPWLLCTQNFFSHRRREA